MFKPPSNNTKRESIQFLEQIIHLGELPPGQVSVDQQITKIITTTEGMFSGQASLWIDRDAVILSHPGINNFVDIRSPGECTPLIRNTIQKNGLVSKTIQGIDGASKQYSLSSPIVINNNIGGVFCIKRQSNRFSRMERQLFQMVTVQAGYLLASTLQRLIDRWSIELLDLVRGVSRHITNIFDIDELSKQITQLIFDKFHYYYVAVFTADSDNRILRFRNSAGKGLSEIETVNLKNFLASGIRFGDGITGHVANTGVELLENNVSFSEHYRFMDSLPETKAEFALPLLFNSVLVGVLDVQSNRINAFSEVDSLVLRALSDHIAIAIGNAQLYLEANNRASHIKLVAEFSKAISSILDFDHLLNNIVSLIHIRFSVPKVNLFTVHTGRRKIFLRASAGKLITTEDLIPGIFAYDLDNSQGLVPWAVNNKQSIVLNDVSIDDRFRISPASPESISSQMAIPLVYGDNILGVLDLQSPVRDAFKRDDIFVLEALADYLSVALRNANLYSSEQWRRQVSESIKEVAGLISVNLDLNQILERILQELHKSLPCEASAIWLVDVIDIETEGGHLGSSLKLAAIHPDNGSLRELLYMDEFPGAQSPWMLEAINSPTPLIRELTSHYEPLGAYLNFPPDYSAIAAPLQANNQIIGLMVLVHSNSGRYGSESQSMTATFAGYSAVAINNTRLYEAAHDQAWVATVLLQVSEATQSITSMAELLETVVRIIPRLIGLKSCVLFTWDELTESFSPEAAFGLSENQLDEYNSWHIAPGDVIAFDHIFEDKYPIIIDHSTIPGETGNGIFSSLDVENEMWGLFPMVAQNIVRGAILINFSSPEGFSNNLQSLFEEKFVIIQGIANQTAVALENITLLKSQEEEAYTSVALLQVAQAIVSLNNLDEIIGTVARITPILVGVNRCVVYLYDPNKLEFNLSQSYGISKQDLSELPTRYDLNENKLIQTVQSTGNVIYRLLSDENESPTKWDNYTQADFNIAQLNPDAGNATLPPADYDFLKFKGRILFALPLVYKNTVLGVMIIEEGDHPKGAPSSHIRLRRLDIVTGITQQTALAIHNDLMQQEIVVREKLEREMQLAREIQKTFLPEHVPSIPGWDLDIHWKPARQVGGDFYDLINLGDGRIGFVIADVADKGMPAALFMILARTLIRAAARDNKSPSEILMQVNDLLVPDAKHGMFITVLIAVFSPNDGTITFANAGHNPPIIHRINNGLQELMPTGMALGILENISIGEQTITIDPGEIIIFYTDGVTEAFTNDEEMFGVDRLRQAILSANELKASLMLAAIEHKLSDFLEGAHQSDDLTIAALIRS